MFLQLYETRVSKSDANQIAVAILFTNIGPNTIRQMQFSVLDSLNTKLIRDSNTTTSMVSIVSWIVIHTQADDTLNVIRVGAMHPLEPIQDILTNNHSLRIIIQHLRLCIINSAIILIYSTNIQIKPNIDDDDLGIDSVGI
jgi:hypothetical protein